MGSFRLTVGNAEIVALSGGHLEFGSSDSLPSAPVEDSACTRLSHFGRPIYMHPPALTGLVLAAHPLPTSRDQRGMPSGLP